MFAELTEASVQLPKFNPLWQGEGGEYILSPCPFVIQNFLVIEADNYRVIFKFYTFSSLLRLSKVAPR